MTGSKERVPFGVQADAKYQRVVNAYSRDIGNHAERLAINSGADEVSETHVENAVQRYESRLRTSSRWSDIVVSGGTAAVSAGISVFAAIWVDDRSFDAVDGVLVFVLFGSLAIGSLLTVLGVVLRSLESRHREGGEA